MALLRQSSLKFSRVKFDIKLLKMVREMDWKKIIFVALILRLADDSIELDRFYLNCIKSRIHRIPWIEKYGAIHMEFIEDLKLIFSYITEDFVQRRNYCACHSNGNRSSSLTNRQPVTNAVPWLVSFQSLCPESIFEQRCAGTLIDKRHVLTAAHCLKCINGLNETVHNEKMFMRVAFHDLNIEDKYDLQTYVNINEIITHPGLIDVAILRLSEDAPIGREVYPAQLPKDDSDQFIGRNVQIGGWGKLGKDSDGLPTFTETTVVSNFECDKVWTKWDYINRISDELLCTDVSDSARSVSGDSGGPVVLMENETPYIIGVISSGHGCSIYCKIPDINIRVSSLLDWIKFNTLDGVCVSASDYHNIPFLPLLYFNYVLIVVWVSVYLTWKNETWQSKMFHRTFKHIYFMLLLSFVVVLIVE